jgi:hypothetical protein
MPHVCKQSLILSRYRSARNGRHDDAAVLAKLAKDTIGQWGPIIAAYLKQIWTIVDDCVEKIANERPSTSTIIS